MGGQNVSLHANKTLEYVKRDTMNTEDFHKRLKELYLPAEGQFTLVDVPEISFISIDGEGSPEDEAFKHAVKWLFSIVHPHKTSL